MKITLDSALLWLLPYLYLVSVTYYWGFWGGLNIDAFNYYEVSDLVKGVTSPLGSTLLVTGFLGLLMAVSQRAIDFIKSFGIKYLFTLIIILLAFLGVIVALMIIKFKQIAAESPRTAAELASYMPPTFAAVVVGAYILNKVLPEDVANRHLRYLLIAFVVILPGQAYLDGHSNAIAIKENIDFEYVVADSLAGSRALYKFLDGVMHLRVN